MLTSFAGALVVVILSLSSSVNAAAIPSDFNNDHDHVARGILPQRWYHDSNHPAHALFKRQDASAFSSFPQVGSPTWAAAYPASTPDSSQMPQAWTQALNNAVQAGKIPNIPQGVQKAPGTAPVYAGLNPTSPQVCSGSYGCRIPGNIYDAPAGTIGIGFDDGPLPPSDGLNQFLHENEIRATHFYIGINILANWNEFNEAFQINQDDIAVHTWTHPYMTTLSNADIVAQLGWTLQLIYNSTGGRLCRYWRPPYGDTDVRVTAIAQEVFGLTAIVWNNDSEDWTLGSPGGITPQAIQANFQKWLSGPQTTGLIVLEHELTNASVQCFMAAYPLMKQYNWNLKSVTTLDSDGPWYNADDDTSTPTPLPLTAAGNSGAGLIAATSTSSTSTPPPPLSPTSSAAGKASASPNSNAKKNGAAPGLSLSLIIMLMTTLALASSLYLI